jgi:ATP-dependent DNA helicase RecQ
MRIFQVDSIVFIDIEVSISSNTIEDIGAIKNTGEIFHSNSIKDFLLFLNGEKYICGHNILRHDLKYLQEENQQFRFNTLRVIDTLLLSPLLFPAKPYHHLVKDDKLQTEELNNPLNDAIKARDLFFDEVNAFLRLEKDIRDIFYGLLRGRDEFKSFFDLLDYKPYSPDNIERLISKCFSGKICSNAPTGDFITNSPVELAYCLALINSSDRYSITPPWVMMNYPDVQGIMFKLRNNPCQKECIYCKRSVNPYTGLEHFFGFNSFRKFGSEPLQEEAVKAALDNKSILVVFPTGGGKSLAFQLPALMSGENIKGLTIVISPLQSLMKDQVDNLEKIGITDVVTINGLLDPIERSKAIERVEEGTASILYIAPESLRSKTIEKILLGRHIVRFVIDEAHCFSSWGQDFRVDYLYIGDFIKSIREKKNLQYDIPVSCFTATAKPKVIEDICNYFREKLSLSLEVIRTRQTRTNLQYRVFEVADKEARYNMLRDLLESKECPTIVYVSRTRTAFDLAARLTRDGFNAKPYHGKMEVREKTQNQDAFIAGDVRVIVATSAFGMGVDKKDIGMIIHYEISDSLENYVQEAGRAGRDENITADCYVLYNDEDLNKHFTLLNQTKLTLKEIKQVWRAIKELTRFRANLSNSALEIARKAGWDDGIAEIEMRVTTAISALEEAGYLKRGQNIPRIFASSIRAKNAQEAIDKINKSERFNEKQKVLAVRIIKKLISGRSRKQANEEIPETRIDYISDQLGIVREEVINVITLLRLEKILDDSRDLQAFIRRTLTVNRSKQIAESYHKIEVSLLQQLEEGHETYYIKEINERATEEGCQDATPQKIRTVLNFWAIKNWIKCKNRDYSKNHIDILCTLSRTVLAEKLKKRHVLTRFIIDYLFKKCEETKEDAEEILVEFSVLELKEAFETGSELFRHEISIEDIEDALFFLSRTEAIKIEGGFLVIYNKLSIEKLDFNAKSQYKKEDYKKLEQFYENKIQQIHIVGEYARKLIQDYRSALQFTEDYFSLNYFSFLRKYFREERIKELSRNLTPAKFNQLFGSLSPSQLKIINDKESRYILVAAGPGSGKTKVLVHKLASLLLMEDIKHEQLLMLTFSRAAASEFKKRLLELYGNAANYVEIKTFHSYCFDLLGKIGSLEKSENIIARAVEKIRTREVEPSRISKMVLVVDEAQDIAHDEFNLIKTLIDENEDMRVVLVGDDDQNIFTFRGADSAYMELFCSTLNAKKYELSQNFRSRPNLVAFSNILAETLSHRLKSMPVVSNHARPGILKLVRHSGRNLEVPLANEIINSNLSGTTCVLTHSNSEALNITGLLVRNGLPAKLIQTNDGFNLYNLLEIRFFLDTLKGICDSPLISPEEWSKSKKMLSGKFQGSTNLDICMNLIRDFEATNTKTKYFSDLEIFIRESKLEDFISREGETIFISTIHKAKGKEFDNVFIMLEDFDLSDDNNKRELYVALTRAKENLCIHHNNSILASLAVRDMISLNDNEGYLPPDELTVQLTFSDVNLGFFEYRQPQIARLVSGAMLEVREEGCKNAKGETILKFSHKFSETLKKLTEQGYKPHNAKINFMIYWKDPEKNEEFVIILPEILFRK